MLEPRCVVQSFGQFRMAILHQTWFLFTYKREARREQALGRTHWDLGKFQA